MLGKRYLLILINIIILLILINVVNAETNITGCPQTINTSGRWVLNASISATCLTIATDNV